MILVFPVLIGVSDRLGMAEVTVSFLFLVKERFRYLLCTSTVREVSHCSAHPLVLAVSPRCPRPSFVLRNVPGSCFGGSWSRAAVGSATSRLGAPRGAVVGSAPGGRGVGASGCFSSWIAWV